MIYADSFLVVMRLPASRSGSPMSVINFVWIAPDRVGSRTTTPKLTLLGLAQLITFSLA